MSMYNIESNPPESMHTIIVRLIRELEVNYSSVWDFFWGEKGWTSNGTYRP